MSTLDKNKFTEIEVLGEIQRVEEEYRFKREIRITQIMDDQPSRKQLPRSNKWRWFVLAVIILAVLVLGIQLIPSDHITTSATSDPNIARIEAFVTDTITTTDTIPQPLQWSIGITEESINDVPMTIYSLGNIDAELIVGQPETTDTSIVFITQAADIRKDNNQIVGDFVLKGEQIATGKRKIGYCAIINHSPTIGMSNSDEMKDFCIANKGDYFRQYILVSDAEAQINKLRGKSIRRALANNGDSLYIVISHNRESLYDFSLALQDIGMTNALYLVGGDSYFAYRTAQGDPLISYGEFETYSPYMNYIIFRHK